MVERLGLIILRGVGSNPASSFSLFPLLVPSVSVCCVTLTPNVPSKGEREYLLKDHGCTIKDPGDLLSYYEISPLFSDLFVLEISAMVFLAP